MCLSEVNIFGNDNVHFGHADNVVTKHHINVYCTVSKTGEYTILRNSSETFIRNRPSITLGKLCLVARRADTLTCHLYGSTDGRILVIALDHSVIELGRAGSGRNHHKRGRYRTLETVRGSVYNAELVIAGLLSNVGSRSTTVKVNCVYTSCLKHDLCNFFHATATGEGLLTTVKYHKYNLTGLCYTYCSTACTAIGVVIAVLNCDFAILNKDRAEACDSLLYLILVNSVVFLGGTDNCCTVLKNTEEAVGVNRVILYATHYEKTAGLTGRHIKACTVGRSDNLVIGNVVFAVGITVLILSCICLIKYALHFPTRSRIIVVIVCKYAYVISGNISSRYVVNHLLTVSRGSVVDRLSDTGSKLSVACIKIAEVRIIVVSYVVTRKHTYVICECIANRNS